MKSHLQHILRTFFITTLLLSATVVNAQMRVNSTYLAYIEQHKDIAIEQMLKHRIPASITLAQALIESAAGKSKLAMVGNNHFGIKCGNWTGKSMRKTDDAPNECFRVYDNARESYEDHSIFLKRDRYASLFKLDQHDYNGWAKGLKACGYATSPTYAQTLINIIETYQLYNYDKAKTYDKFMAQHVGSAHLNSDDISEANPNGTLVLHNIYIYNSNYYLIARSGDTFYSIAEEIGISSRKLAKYNERNRKEPLSEGDIIYLKKKQNHATKEFKDRPHVVANGESMYSISQKYAIRLKSLYKMNKLKADYQIKVGDRLRVR